MTWTHVRRTRTEVVRSWALAGVGTIGLLGACAADAPEPSVASAIGAGLRGPAGVTATIFADALPEAASLAFDDAGRLWIGTAAFEDDGADSVSLVTAPGAEPVEVITSQHKVLGLVWVGDELFVTHEPARRAR